MLHGVNSTYYKWHATFHHWIFIFHLQHMETTYIKLMFTLTSSVLVNRPDVLSISNTVHIKSSVCTYIHFCIDCSTCKKKIYIYILLFGCWVDSAVKKKQLLRLLRHIENVSFCIMVYLHEVFRWCQTWNVNICVFLQSRVIFMMLNVQWNMYTQWNKV